MAHMPADQRSRQIIEAASAIVAEEGLGQATTRRIAERAQAPLASLHYTFRDKEELVAGVYEYWFDRLAEEMASAVPEDCGLEAGIRALMTEFYERNATNITLGLAEWELFVWAMRTPSAHGLAASIYTRFQALIVDRLTRAAGDSCDPKAIDELANYVACAIQGTLVKLLALNDAQAARADLDRFIESATELARRRAA